MSDSHGSIAKGMSRWISTIPTGPASGNSAATSYPLPAMAAVG